MIRDPGSTDENAWVLASWNCSGYRAAAHEITRDSELSNMITQSSPTVLMLQETWHSRNSKIRRKALRDYTVFNSAVATAEDNARFRGKHPRKGRVKAGLITAIHNSLRPGSNCTSVHTSTGARGYLLPQLLNTGPQKTLLINVYLPPLSHRRTRGLRLDQRRPQGCPLGRS